MIKSYNWSITMYKTKQRLRLDEVLFILYALYYFTFDVNLFMCLVHFKYNILVYMLVTWLPNEKSTIAVIND